VGGGKRSSPRFLLLLGFLSLTFRPAQIQQAGPSSKASACYGAGKKEGVWGRNFCQRLLSREAGVSVWGLLVYAPPPSSSLGNTRDRSVGGANIRVFARKKFERNRANTTFFKKKWDILNFARNHYEQGGGASLRLGRGGIPPHLFEPEGLSEPERPPSAAPSLGLAKFFAAGLQINQCFQKFIAFVSINFIVWRKN